MNRYGYIEARSVASVVSLAHLLLAQYRMVIQLKSDSELILNPRIMQMSGGSIVAIWV